MLTAAQVRHALRDRNLALVAREIGMNRQQLWMIATGVTMPRADTLERISNYLEGKTDGPNT